MTKKIITDANLGTEAYYVPQDDREKKQEFVSGRADFSLGACQKLSPDSFLSIDAVVGMGVGDLTSASFGGRVAYHFGPIRFGIGTGTRYHFDQPKTSMDDGASGLRGLYGQAEWGVLFHNVLPKKSRDYYVGLRSQAMLTTTGDAALMTGIEIGFGSL